MLSKEQADQFAAEYERFIEAAEEAERRYREITDCEYWYADKIYLEDGDVIFEGEEHRGYGEWTHHSNSLPFRALYDELYWEELETEIREKERKEKTAARRRERDAARRKREKELKELEKLQAKYPERAAAGG